MKNRNNTLRSCAIGIVSLLAGFALAGFVFSKRSEPRLPEKVWVSTAADSPAIETVKFATKPMPMDVDRLMDFATKFYEMEGESAKVRASLAWIDTLQADDFEALFSLSQEINRGDFDLQQPERGYVSDFVESVFDELDRSLVGAYFYDCWAQRFPESLVRALETLPVEEAISLGWLTLPKLLADDAPTGGLAFTRLREREPERFDDRLNQAMFARRIYQIDEVAAVRWALSNGVDPDEELFHQGISDGRGVLQELLAIPEAERRAHGSEVSNEFFRKFSVMDPDGAKALFAEFGNQIAEGERAGIGAVVEANWVLEDPAARLEIESLDKDVEDVLSTWLKRDPQAVLEWLQSQPDPELGGRFGRIVTAMFEQLPFDFAIEHAADLGSELGEVKWATALSDEQLARLVEQAPDAGLAELFRRNPEAALALGAGREGSLRRLVYLADEFESDDYRQRVLDQLAGYGDGWELERHLFQSWAEHDPVAALATSDRYLFGASAVVDRWLEYEDPEVVYAAVGEGFAEDEWVQDAIMGVWAQRDPWSAGEALIVNGRTQGMAQLIHNWVWQDSVEASRFIREKLEPGVQRDLAAQALAVGVAQRDPAGAQEWARSIGDEGLREATLTKLQSNEP